MITPHLEFSPGTSITYSRSFMMPFKIGPVAQHNLCEKHVSKRIECWNLKLSIAVRKLIGAERSIAIVNTFVVRSGKILPGRCLHNTCFRSGIGSNSLAY